DAAMPNPTRRLTRLALGAAALALVALAAFLVYVFGTEFLAPHWSANDTLRDRQAAQPAPSDTFKLSFLPRARALPELRFADGDGRPLTLGDFSGRPVVLNIWATWCVPCRKEMPALDRLQAAFDKSRLAVLPLSIDRQGASVVRQFYREVGLKALGIYLDPSGKVSRDVDVSGVPTTLLIDRDGHEIARKLGPAEWDSPAMTALIRDHLGLAASGRKASP
ncbi:MAG: TlpA family protein disulfide reductase, partial [Stellaceae bacterium]